MNEKLQSRLDSVLGAVLVPIMIWALYMAFVGAPREKTMGDIQRIFYFHVSAGITGLIAFAVNFAASLMYVVRKNRRWDQLALSAAEIGVLFFFIVLVTGPIWAKPVWFVWWTWTARLTSSLILCLLYVAYLLIRNYIEDPERKAMVSAVFGIIAFVDAPLVWFSIRWWRDIHPSAVMESGGLPDPAMRLALGICVAAHLVLFLYLLRRRFYLEVLRDKVEWLARRANIAH